MPGIHHIMLTVEDDHDAGQITEPPWAYCRVDVVAGVAMLTLTPLTESGEIPLGREFQPDLSPEDTERLGEALIEASRRSDDPVDLHALAERLNIRLRDAPQRQFSVSAYGLHRALEALMLDAEHGEPEDWANRTKRAYEQTDPLSHSTQSG